MRWNATRSSLMVRRRSLLLRDLLHAAWLNGQRSWAHVGSNSVRAHAAVTCCNHETAATPRVSDPALWGLNALPFTLSRHSDGRRVVEAPSPALAAA